MTNQRLILKSHVWALVIFLLFGVIAATNEEKVQGQNQQNRNSNSNSNSSERSLGPIFVTGVCKINEIPLTRKQRLIERGELRKHTNTVNLSLPPLQEWNYWRES